MKKFTMFVFAVAVLMVPVMSAAEIREGSFEISPYAGYHILGDANRSDNNKNEASYGLRLGYNKTDRLGLEVAYDHIVKTSDMAHIDALYHFTPERSFNPFFVAGLGYASNKNNGNTLMGNFGLGFKYFLNSTVAIRVDVRDVITNMQSVSATAGLTFVFGGKTPTTPPQSTPPSVPVSETKPSPAQMDAKPAPVPAPVKIVLEDVHFDFDKATLTNAAKAILAKDIKILKTNPSIKVQVEGHTCAHGNDDYNRALGERRANAVKEYLVKEGIAADRLTTISYGETRLAVPETPTAKNINSSEAKENRRVHFEVISK